ARVAGQRRRLVELAKLLAASGEPSVVVDADLRRPMVHQRLGVAREPGLTDVITQQLELTSLIHPTREKSLSVLPSGPIPPNAPALLARPEIAASLDRLRRHFRWGLGGDCP